MRYYIIRGGSWYYASPGHCTVHRAAYKLSSRGNGVSFRLTKKLKS